MKKIFHVGHNDKQRKTHDIINGKKAARKEYQLWSSMLNRCYNPYMLNEKTAYIDCHVDEFFHSYTNFYDWCQDQVGFDFPDYHLDKDVLAENLKIYSPENCIFIPKCINTLFNKRYDIRGEYPIGVGVKKNTYGYQARMSMDGKVIVIGYFDTVEMAFLAYKKTKEDYIKKLTKEYKYRIDKRAYDALMRYEVNIND